MKQKLKKIAKKVRTKILSKVIATFLRMRHRAITCKNQILINNSFSLYGEMKRGREFPSVTSGQLHSAVTPLSISLIPIPTPSALSPRANEVRPSSCASTSASKRGRGSTCGVGLEKSLGSGSKSGKLLSANAPEEVKQYIMDRVLDHFDLDNTRQEDVRTKFPSKETVLLKPHPNTTEEQWKELCDLFTSEAFMKRSEQNKKNRLKLTVNYAAGSCSFQLTRACMEPFHAALSSKVRGIILHCLLRQMTSTSKRGRDRTRGVSMEKSLQSGSGSGKLSMHIPEGECGGVSSTAATLSTKIGMLVRGLILISVNKWANVPVEVKEYVMDQVLHQLAKARDEIETMRDAREKELQEFVKKQAKMETTLRDHREEQRVEQERIRLEQEERMKREQERMQVDHEKRMQQEQERMRKEQEHLRAEISKELEKKMSSVMEKKMSDMSKRLFSQFGGSKGRCMYIVITF
ncbi:hypothetical protein CJ030_MR5G025114 [Morella rubra]|uniref:Uncharacterized protein n=1 Tax=Morella rubra TaxID=262757 RepID=A0A6A1VKH7_9ROSI|nr:hypothetical protein CJ030_MR5G025114 [Morella rubra]